MLDNVLITQMGIRRETMPFSQSYLLIPPLPRIRNRLATALFVFIKLLLPIKRIWCEFVTYKSVANGLARNVDANVLLNICVMNDIRNMMIYRLTNTTTTTTNIMIDPDTIHVDILVNYGTIVLFLVATERG